MAKKVNKRGTVKSGNSQLILKKERQNEKSGFSKLSPDDDIKASKSFISRTFLFIDRMRPFPIAVLGM